MARLGDIEPRERAGAKTGRRYDYQYERAARRVLDLLDHQQKHVCVYCDWHDDFVVERGDPPTRYVFHQVKGRKTGLGAWKFLDFFGLTKRETPNIPAKVTFSRKAIVPLMLQHHGNFKAGCEGLAFVTNTGIEPQLESFMNALKVAATLADLTGAERNAFDHIAKGYLAGKSPLAPSADALFERVRAISLWLDEGHLDDESVTIRELVDLIHTYSEIDLSYPQSKNIAREIINKVRLKAHHDKTLIPATEEQLRTEKGIVVTELLGLLSLSTDGYNALRRGDAPADIKTLSRLQRYCQRIKREDLIPFVCSAKAAWVAWRTAERHLMDPLDFVALLTRARDIVAMQIDIRDMVKEARIIAKEFEGLTSAPLSDTQVLGLMFALIADAEPPFVLP
jgi:hypothetical protein